jgi:ribosomal protein S18 acetylase RimI-like enzyme
MIIDSTIELIELASLAEKMKWLERFQKSYTGAKAKTSNKFFDSGCKFLVAKASGKKLGYIRIIDRTSELSKFGATNTWSVSEAYVKPAYRNQGVLRKMLKVVISDYNTKLIKIETERLETNYSYYETLGFKNAFAVKNSELSIAYLDDIAGVINLRNQSLKK